MRSPALSRFHRRSCAQASPVLSKAMRAPRAVRRLYPPPSRVRVPEMTVHSAAFPSPCPTDNPLSPVTLAKGGSTEMQKFSQIEKSYVDEARRMARHLIATEAAGPGDIVNAMQRIEVRYGVPFSLLKSLRYRTPKDIYMSAWFRLVAAYEAQCERQARRLNAELEHARTLKDAIDAPAVRAAEAALLAEETARGSAGNPG